MSWDDVAAHLPREPQDDLRGGAGDEPDDLDRRPWRDLTPNAPHPADCGCSVHGKPRPLAWWANWRRG